MQEGVIRTGIIQLNPVGQALFLLFVIGCVLFYIAVDCIVGLFLAKVWYLVIMVGPTGG